MTTHYYGESTCQKTYKSNGLPCKNVAYYSDVGLVVCGVHSSKKTRVKPPTNPNKVENEQKQQQLIKDEIAEKFKNKNLIYHF